MRPTKTQISLHIRAVLSGYPLSAQIDCIIGFRNGPYNMSSRLLHYVKDSRII